MDGHKNKNQKKFSVETRPLIYTAKNEKQSSLVGRSLLNDDNAISYGIIILVGFIVLGGLLYILLTPIFNGLVDAVNSVIELGYMSEQTADAFLWNQRLFLAIPVIALIGISIWAIVRANERGA